MGHTLCTRQWRWLACAHAMFSVRGMRSMTQALETYFAPASKLRRRGTVIRTAYVKSGRHLPAKMRDERVFCAVGTWVARARAPM